jgi:hypothetical protein
VRTAPRNAALRLRVLAPAALVLAAVVVAILTLTGGPSAAAPSRVTADPGGPPVTKSGWVPSGDISGGGGVDAFRCSPQTVTGSESTATLEADAILVGSGSTDGHSWSVWSKKGVKGGPGLEEGGVIIDGVAHGLCAGFPNPAEMELLDPSGGGDAIAYGVVGYPGVAKVDIYASTANTLDAGKLVGSTTSQVANGVGFFITRLSQSGCDLSALELNTASASYAAEHNFGFATNHCSTGQLVPISDSDGIWQLPRNDFPNKFQSNNGSSSGPELFARTGPDFSSCSPPTDPASSGASATSVPDATRVTSGTVDGLSWSLWSKRGEHGSAGLENAGVILDGHAFGICPGAPNPAEFELLDPPGGGNGIVIGVSGYLGSATGEVYATSPDSFTAGALLYRSKTVDADGTGFFIGELPKSACSYQALLLKIDAKNGDSEHDLSFGSCQRGRLSTIDGGEGSWSAGR